MNTIGSFVDSDGGLLMATPHHVVALADAGSEASATQWWTTLTESGGEGAVVKPLSFVATSSRGLLQPAVKCRGREYLRIIYGPVRQTNFRASQELMHRLLVMDATRRRR